MRLTKIEAAIRQLDTAIQLHFEGRDPISVCTLVGAAGRVLSDLLDHHGPSQSWRKSVLKSFPNVSPRDIYAVMDRIPNFFKHADRDPEDVETFDEVENEDRMFIACDECVELRVDLSIEMQVFRIWYVACHPDRFSEIHDDELVRAGKDLLPGMSGIDHQVRISIGGALLAEQKRIAESELAI